MTALNKLWSTVGTALLYIVFYAVGLFITGVAIVYLVTFLGLQTINFVVLLRAMGA